MFHYLLLFCILTEVTASLDFFNVLYDEKQYKKLPEFYSNKPESDIGNFLIKTRKNIYYKVSKVKTATAFDLLSKLSTPSTTVKKLSVRNPEPVIQMRSDLIPETDPPSTTCPTDSTDSSEDSAETEESTAVDETATTAAAAETTTTVKVTTKATTVQKTTKTATKASTVTITSTTIKCPSDEPDDAQEESQSITDLPTTPPVTSIPTTVSPLTTTKVPQMKTKIPPPMKISTTTVAPVTKAATTTTTIATSICPSATLPPPVITTCSVVKADSAGSMDNPNLARDLLIITSDDGNDDIKNCLHKVRLGTLTCPDCMRKFKAFLLLRTRVKTISE